MEEEVEVLQDGHGQDSDYRVGGTMLLSITKEKQENGNGFFLVGTLRESVKGEAVVVLKLDHVTVTPEVQREISIQVDHD